MPRIRTLKPEFWQDEKLSALDPLVRLVFLGLISLADDAGRVLDNPKFIDAFVFPNTEDTCRDAVGLLARLSRVLRYTTESGQSVLQIVHWQRHQKIDHPSKPTFPAPPTEVLTQAQVATPIPLTRENLASISRDPRPSNSTSTSTRTSTSTNNQLVEFDNSTPKPAVAVAHLNGKNGKPGRMVAKPMGIAEIPTWIAAFVADAAERSDSNLRTEARRRVQAGVVFLYWASAFGHPKALLDRHRERRIMQRLVENGDNLDELLWALDGARKDPWITGRDPKASRPYDGLETILRDREQVERFANVMPGYRKSEPHPAAEKYLRAGGEPTDD